MISVVIPLYNKAHTIQRTINSVLNQTFENFEIIIINDGSTDNSLDVINQNFNDDRIKIFNQVNSGVSIARNNGVIYSLYDYIAFLDGDDDWEKNYLELINEAIIKYPNFSMICTAGYIKDAKNGNKILRLAKKYKNTITEIDYFENPHVFTHTSATIVNKRDFLKIQGGFPSDLKKNEDYALFFSIALIGDTIYCGYPVSNYYGNIDNQATQIMNENFLDVSKRINKTFKTWEKMDKKNSTFLTFYKYELRHLILYLLNKNDYSNISIILSGLSNIAINNISVFEKFIYSRKIFKHISIIYIYITKIIWRSKNYPRFGQ